MSDPISALDGITYEGFAKVEEMGLCGMITLRGDLSSAALTQAAAGAAGVDMVEQGHANTGKDSALAWMSPDELLLMVPYAQVDETLAQITGTLKDEHHLAVNVSDARAVFKVSGAGAREVVAKLAPVDMTKAAFKPGQFRRTRLAQVPAAFWMDAEENLTIICFRSVADYMFSLLKTSAEPGSEVGYIS